MTRLLTLLVLLLPSVAWAQVGFLQAVPGTPRPTCPSIPSPVKNQTWCADASGGPATYFWKVWNGTQYVTVGGGGGGGTPAPPDTSVQFNNAGVFGGDSQHLWNNTLKRLQVGTLPLGMLAPGPLVVGTVAPTGTGKQAGLFQTTTGTNAGEGLVTLGADNVAVSGWAFRGADGSNPLYGGNFGTHFLGPGQVRGVEIDVQNHWMDTGIGDFGHNVALWLNRSGPFNSSSAIEISSQDPRGWWFGIHFDPGDAGTGGDTLIKGWGMYAFRAMPDQYIGFVPSDDLNPQNDIITLFAFDETTVKAKLNKRGQWFSRGDDTGVTMPAFTFVDESNTGMYLVATNQLGLAVNGTEVFKAVTSPVTGTLTHGYITSFGTTFAGLGAVINGAIIYCSDCLQNNPCAGGGTGAFALGINAAWDCNASVSGGTGTPAGPVTSIQVNAGAGNFGGFADFTWDDVNKNLTVGAVVAPSAFSGNVILGGTGNDASTVSNSTLIGFTIVDTGGFSRLMGSAITNSGSDAEIIGETITNDSSDVQVLGHNIDTHNSDTQIVGQDIIIPFGDCQQCAVFGQITDLTGLALATNTILVQGAEYVQLDDFNSVVNIGVNGVGSTPQVAVSAVSVALTVPMTLASVIFTALGAPADGSMLYCTDCDPTATLLACTHAGAQTGAFAYRVNGAWKCSG